MKLSKKAEYAMRALLAMARAPETSTFAIQDIAASEHIPLKFLEQIFQTLKDAGLIESQRGKFGGYRLAKPAREIPIGAVVRLIDGPLAPIGCVSQSAYEKCSCPDETHCGLRMLMLDVRNAVAGILDRIAPDGRIERRQLHRKQLGGRGPQWQRHVQHERRHLHQIRRW